MKTLITFLLMTSLAYGAQSITIPEGTTTYGPIPFNSADRFGEMVFTRNTSTFKLLTINLYFSEDWNGKTGTWQWYCRIVHPGAAQNGIISAGCSMVAGKKPTHIKADAVAEGGSVVITAAPTMRSK